MIWLHPEQLKYITRRMTGMCETGANQVKELERRLSVLTAGMEEFVCDSGIRGEILDDCHNGLELIALLDGLMNLAWEFGGVLTPAALRRPQSTPTSDSNHKPSTNVLAKKENAAKHDDGQQLGLDV